MNKAIALLCVVMPALAASGCQDESRAKPIEVIVVSGQLAGGARYNIDLNREDAIYFLAPNLDASRLSVTCPTLATISFAEYVVSRIRPTGSKYDPKKEPLELANARVPREVMSRLAEAQFETCTEFCMDDPDSGLEYCWSYCNPDPEP